MRNVWIVLIAVALLALGAPGCGGVRRLRLRLWLRL